MPRPFTLETLVDFVDDALSTPLTITPAHVDSLMSNLARAGVRRVIWGYYGDGHGGWFSPAGIERYIAELGIAEDQNYWGACLRTYKALGNPLRVAVDAAHRHGIEVYAYFKPYETGPAMSFHEGSPEGLEWGRLPIIGGYLTWLDPFVVKNPHLRIKRRTDDMWPGHESAATRSIRLTKKDASPTRVTKANLQVWTSDRNYGYRRVPADAGYDLVETVEPSPREVRDVYGNVVTRAGQPVRVLTLRGLNLTDRFVAVTTAITSGTPDFENAWDRLLTAYDERGQEIPGVYATGTAIWFPELERFPEGGLVFDTGRGPEVVALDAPRSGVDYAGPESAKHHIGFTPVRGVIAFARGRNAYLSGALCETEPAVQEYWLRCLGEILDAGVDGVEFRVENHSAHSDTPQDYGFNPIVVEKAGIRAGETPDLGAISRVRSEAYTDFLRRANRAIKGRGKRMRVNLNVDWFRPPEERPGSRKIAYPANIEFHWRQWVDEGLLDEAMLRVFAKPFEGIFGADATAQEMVAHAAARGIPVTVNRYVWDNPGLADELTRVRDDGRFAGFVLYETWSYTKINPDGTWTIADTGADENEAAGPVAKARVRTARHVRAALSSRA